MIIAKLSEFVLIGLIDKRFKYNPQNGFVSQSLTDKSIKEYLDIFSVKPFYQCDDLNDLLEYFNILIYLKDTNDKNCIIDSCEFRALGENFKCSVGRFFNSIKSEEEFKEIVKSVSPLYKCELITVYSLFNNATKKFLTDDIINFLCENSYLYCILSNKSFLKQHAVVLKKFLFSHVEYIDDFITKKLLNSDAPFKFTSDEFNNLVYKYLHLPSEKIYACTLEDILKNRLLSKENRFAVTKHESLILKDRKGMEFENIVKFIPQNELSKIEYKEDHYFGKLSICYSYDIKWLQKYQDYQTILNNFIYFFDFQDYWHDTTFVSCPLFSNGSILKKLGLVKLGLKDFDSNTTWNSIFTSYVLKTSVYCNFLNKHKIFLEDVINWFFSNYIKSEFSIDNFNVNIKAIKDVAPYSVKLKILLPEFESIFKQFEAYCEYNYVNHEYISSSLSIGENSYPEALKPIDIIYVEKSDSADAKTIFEELFTENYVLNVYKSLYEFLMKKRHQVISIQLQDYYKNLNLIFKANILSRNTFGEIVVDYQKLDILEEIESYGYLCFSVLEQSLQDKILELKSDNLLTSYNSFMSKQENDLFNFVFNNKFSNNPLGLRNLYLHGNPCLNEKEHETNYFISLTMMIVLVLKLNDAFTIMTSKEQGKGRFNNVLEDENSIILT